MANQVAPQGQVYVCGACGKRSRDEYGDQPINRGWDVSCVLNALLCYEDKIVVDPVTNLVTQVPPEGLVPKVTTQD
jgi:hypothetical protein